MSETREERELPSSGESLHCMVCAYEKPWGVFDSKTGAAVCVECRDGAREAPTLRAQLAAAEREREELKAKVDELECALDDEEAAHQETLNALDLLTDENCN